MLDEKKEIAKIQKDIETSKKEVQETQNFCFKVVGQLIKSLEKEIERQQGERLDWVNYPEHFKGIIKKQLDTIQYCEDVTRGLHREITTLKSVLIGFEIIDEKGESK